MAARKQRWHPEEVRKRIQASQLINRLTSHAISEKPLMDNSQVSAANILLRKILPDLTATEHSGNPDKPMLHKLQIEFVRSE